MSRNEQRLSASCDSGTLDGLDRGATKVFKGIQFASASRLSDPVDIESWNGTIDATSFQPQAPQSGGSMERLLGRSSLPTNENCLYLNVYTPSCDGQRRPVLFWIHGGAFLTGGGAMPWYDGSRLATNGDVVIVTINYRLGALGFLGQRNSGTLDQVSALRWVARNIESFGGDPDNVTVFGQSAGGAAAIALMATPTADQLFRRVWAMSPSIPQLRTTEQADLFEQRFLNALGPSSADRLQEAALEDLLAAQNSLAGDGLRIFAPTEGTPSIPDTILNVASLDPRPLVIGATRDESALFTAFDPSRAGWNEEDVEREFELRFGSHSPQAVEAYRDHQPEATSNQLVTAMQTDQIFRWPAWSLTDRRCSEAAARATWMYSFDYATPSFGGVLGSCHGLDIPFAFDNLHRPGVEMFTGPGNERQDVASQYSDAIVAFAHDANPGWPEYDNNIRATQRIGPEPGIVNNPEPELRALWQARNPDHAVAAS